MIAPSHSAIIAMQTAYISHPLCLKHDMGAHHPECPARIHAIEDQLIASGLFGFLQHHEAPEATREQLSRVHTPVYLDAIAAAAPQHGMVELDGDTSMNPFSYSAALHAAGAVVMGVDLVMAGKVENAFCNIRPPGHHAERGRAMGFCIFNNVAVAAAHALAAHGLSRVAIADFDVHHGNGSEGFREAVTDRWLPALEEFKPELLLISAGFDAHRDDDMAMLRLVDADYGWVTEQLKKLAYKHCHRRIVSTLEGGYELHALGRSAMAHIKVLSGL
jgi:acetoin utilization deacetylase AcuC-like enzyme